MQALVGQPVAQLERAPEVPAESLAPVVQVESLAPVEASRLRAPSKQTHQAPTR